MIWSQHDVEQLLEKTDQIGDGKGEPSHELTWDLADALRDRTNTLLAVKDELERLSSLIEISPPLAKQTELLNERDKLRKNNERLTEALKAFAEYHGSAANHHHDDCLDVNGCEACLLDDEVIAALAESEKPYPNAPGSKLQIAFDGPVLLPGGKIIDARAGDVIELRSGRIFINGVELPEDGKT